jgi:hypothetical protein
MLFKPENTRLWDTFILEHDSKFYLFYLSLTERAWDGYGLAISDDLIHWEDRGLILEADPDVIGMGSGSVWRAGDRWILNFSYGEQGSQRIYFAESDDLLTWRKLPKDIICAPDPRWYECTGETSSTNARWDNIWSVPQEDGSFIGFVVASGKDGPAGANGVAGVVSSSDGVHWVTEKPATEPCGMVWAEASCYFRFEDRHYLLVGSTTGLGPRFDPIYNSSGKAGGMYVMMSDSIRGPYKLVDGDPLLLGCRNAPPNWAYIPTYYARVLETDGQYLLYHHWMPRADFLDSWLGTMKVVKEDAPGRLSLHYWTGNDKLKGDLIFDLMNTNQLLTPSPQPIRASSWVYSSGILTGRTDSSTLAYYELSVDYSSGVVIEADISINGPGAAGIFFGIDEQTDDRPYEGVACLANSRGLYEFGRVTSGIAGPTFMAENHILRDIPQNTTMKWRILLRDEFVEWYVDDQLVQCYGFSSPASHNIGVFAERCQIELNNLTLHKFA